MAAAATKSPPKPALYKMVSIPSAKMGTGTKKTSSDSTAVSSYSAFLTGINKLGATVNSMIIINLQILKSLQEGLKLKNSELENERKKFESEKANKNKMSSVGDGKINWAEKFAGAAVAGVSDFFEGLAQLGQFFLRAFLGQAILRWIADPKNGEKLAKIVGGLIKVFTWLFKFITENLAKTIEGLVDMFDSNLGFWDRLKGFGSFITGFGALLLGFAFLRNPVGVLKAFKFVLEKLFGSLTKSKQNIAKQSAALDKAGANAAKGGFGSWSADMNQRGPKPPDAPKVKGPGGKAKLLLGGLALAGTAFGLGAMMGGGDKNKDKPPAQPQQSGSLKPASGGMEAQEPSAAGMDIPFSLEGGVFTKPTASVVGERGPEMRVPLGPRPAIPADNNQRRSRAGIQPLSSLGGMGPGSGFDSKKADSLSKLFLAPFKGIGTGIISNITETVGQVSGAAGATITPMLGGLITPIANAFGVPPTIVKSAAGKGASKSDATKPDKKKKSILPGLFGKGTTPNVSKDQKNYAKKGQTTVLGLLSDMLGAALVIANKIGGKKEGSGTSSGPGPTKKDGTGGGKVENDMHVGDSVARGLSGGQGEGTDADATKVGRSSKGVLDYLKSQGKEAYKDKTLRLSSGILNSPKDLKSVEEQLKFLKEAGAKVQLVGVPTNNPTYAPLNEKLKALAKQYGATWLGGYEAGSDKIHPKDYTTLKAKFDTEVKDATTSVDQSIDKNYGMKVGDERKFKASDGNEYIAHKTKEGFKFFRTGVAGAADNLGAIVANVLGQTDKEKGENKAAVDTTDGKNTFLITDWAKSEGGKKPLPPKKMSGGFVPKFSGGGPLNVLNEKAGGGWINGPMSGYPVSLDGGRSIAFEGHGKEWVGFKKASGGAFVVPFNTPATKGSPNLTNRRMTEAKAGGYQLPTFNFGGITKASKPIKSIYSKKAAGGKVRYDLASSKLGADNKSWDIFRDTIASIESGGKYNIKGGSGGHYDGRYQLGAAAKKDGSRQAGVKDPGHGAAAREAFRKDPDLQETLFAGYTAANHRYLLGNADYKKKSLHQKMQILGYAHNQGMGGAEKWMKTGVVGKDGFGTKGTKYTDALAAAFKSGKAPDAPGTGGGDTPDETKEGSDDAAAPEKTKEEQLSDLLGKLADDIVKLNTPSDGAAGATPGTPAEVAAAGDAAGKNLNKMDTKGITAKAFAPASSGTGQALTAATASVKANKVLADKAQQTKITSAATAAFGSSKAVPPGSGKPVATQQPPIILPGRDRNLAIEAYNPSASMFQYNLMQR